MNYWKKNGYIFLALTLIIGISGCSKHTQSLSFGNDIPSPNTRFSLSLFQSTQVMKNPAPLDVSILLTLPVYPNSQEEKGSNHQQPPTYPDESYLYEGASNVFLVPAGKKDAENWFTCHLASEGYSLCESGRFGNSQTTTDFLSFKKINNPDVEVTFLPKDTNHTIIQYFGEYIMPPARLSDSLLPNTIQEVDIGYCLVNSRGAFITKPVVVKDLSVINELVSAVNKMTVDTANAHSCPCITPNTKELTAKFITSKKDIYTLTQSCGAFMLTHGNKTFPLVDLNNNVFSLIKQIYGRKSSVTK